jgi:16S rRNA processing protein RimM
LWTEDSKLLELGAIVKPHGVRGELKVQLHWPQSTTLFELAEVLVTPSSGAARSFRVELARPSPKGALLRLEGVDSREAAEALRGAKLSARRADLPALQDGEYYLADLIGCEVKSPGRTLGRVVEIQTHPTLDSIVILGESGDTYQQPLNDAWVDEVRLAERLIVLVSEDGLIQGASALASSACSRSCSAHS